MGSVATAALQKKDFYTFEDMLYDITPWSPMYRQVSSNPPPRPHMSCSFLHHCDVEAASHAEWPIEQLTCTVLLLPSTKPTGVNLSA